jgi:hypothetical protein
MRWLSVIRTKLRIISWISNTSDLFADEQLFPGDQQLKLGIIAQQEAQNPYECFLHSGEVFIKMQKFQYLCKFKERQ